MLEAIGTKTGNAYLCRECGRDVGDPLGSHKCRTVPDVLIRDTPMPAAYPVRPERTPYGDSSASGPIPLLV